MRGSNGLIALRKAGVAPDWVWVDTDLTPAPFADETTLDNCIGIRLQIEKSDKPNRLDLRCVVGLNCYVQGETASVVHATRDACIDAGAKRVIAAVMDRKGRGEFVSFGVSDLTDTAGIFVLAGNEEVIHG